MPQRPLLSLLSLILVLCTLTAGLYRLDHQNTVYQTGAEQPSSARRITTVVLDPGHGGEDPGTASAEGILEKDLNLTVSLLLRDILTAAGIEVVMTREDDRLLYDRDADYEGHKKKLDAAERKRIAEETPDAVYVAIHMNTYPLESCQGLQVWYSQNNAASYTLAKGVQDTVKAALQPQNHRTVKAAGSNIYLLDQITAPAVLIECGFLSSPEECAMLCDKAYQQQLALTIATAILNAEL